MLDRALARVDLRGPRPWPTGRDSLCPTTDRHRTSGGRRPVTAKPPGTPRSAPDAAALILRLALGSFWLVDGFFLKGWALGSDDRCAWLAAQGLPAVLAMPLIVAEIVAALFIMSGEYGRWMSLALVPVLMFGVALPDTAVWAFSDPQGGLLYPMSLLALSFAHGLLGDGSYVLPPKVDAVPEPASR